MDISFFCNLALVYGNRHMEISNFSYNRELGVVKITLFFLLDLLRNYERKSPYDGSE